MARRPSLKPKLNQIRTWVGEGVTDIWIAHQLESTPAEVADFRRKHGLLRADEAPAPAPRARRAAAPKTAAPRKAAAPRKTAAPRTPAPAEDGDGETAEAPAEGAEPAKRRRRGRRGGRGRGRGRSAIAATIEHGPDGVVIRIDAEVLESPAYREHWTAIAAGEVAITPTGIAIAPSSAAEDGETGADDAAAEDDES